MLSNLPLFTPPIIEQHNGFTVVRDDLFPGGTKSRFIPKLFDGVDELVYATPSEGGAQTALAYAARVLGKKVTLFVAKRRKRHDRVELSIKLGANVVTVEVGYLSVCQKRARDYARDLFTPLKRRYLEFGLSEGVDEIAEAAALIPKPTELWFAAGSGTLARGLGKAWPDVPRFAVQVGHILESEEVADATIVEIWQYFELADTLPVPFPSDYHYDAKAWHAMVEQGKPGATFWNVAGPASSYEHLLSDFEC
jgi:hypothetical protein